MANKACNFLREVDDLFTDGNVDVTKYNAFTACHSYCPYENRKSRPCKNNYERISALGGYLYNKLVSISNDFKGEGDNGNRHIEIFIMWLGDKLFKIDNDYKATLEESYKNNLENHTGNFKYWRVIGSKKDYKESNVSYISELYSLLNCICKLINEYKKNPESKEIGRISPQCYQKFKNIYDKVKECYSYFHLLKNLKNIYDGFKNVAIKNASTRNTHTYSPNNRYRMMALKYIMSASKVPLIDLTTSDWNTRFKDVSDRTLDFHTQPCVELRTKIEQKQEKHAPKDPKKATLTSGNRQSGKEGNKKTTERPKPAKPKKPDSSKQKRRSQKPNIQRKKQPPLPQTPTHTPVEPPIQTKKTESPPPQPQQSSQQIPPVPADPTQVQNGSSSQTHQTGGPKNSNESKDSGNGKENTGGTNNNTGGSSSGNENPGGGSNVPTSSTSEGSFNFGSSIFEFLLNGTKILNKASEFIKDNQQKFKDAAEKISGAYNQVRDNLKTTYDQSNKYLNKLINDVIGQLNKNDTPSKSNDKQLGPGSPMGVGDKYNLPSSNTQPNLPPTSPKDPQPNQPSTPPIDPTQQKQTSSQSQPTTQKSAQVNQINHKTDLQLIKSPIFDPILKKRWNIFPTIWNGSGNCKSEIKLMNTTLVCCTYKQCSLTGISVTFILIPIILLIVYKYLLREWTKKSEKKNMKRVINFHDGNRKTKIIVSSNDRNKHLKPVINSVGGKKDSLLNIYKLIQADPMPFINLFFLLIFFVYKRKRDTIE
ncbi:CIR protein PIR protein [Plasmodium vinckei lentum]|uniref:CIR protein PIR protein n=1 Tax=Plasmodium vinckei lentum TaxID=138297 RepID=A0A6V7T1Y9_PLAVN|nr:CIR protein PIR protein [Plasmodium vinckei lentum]